MRVGVAVVVLFFAGMAAAQPVGDPQTNGQSPAQPSQTPVQSEQTNQPAARPSSTPASATTTPVPQTQAAQTPAAEEALPESWLDGFKWKALVRLRPESRGNFDFDKKTDDQAEYVGQKIQFGFEKDFFDDMSANVVVQDSRVWGGQPGSKTGVSTANDSTSESTDLRIGWLEMRSLGPFDVRVGRQVFRLGEERLVGAAEWGNVGRSFDGFSVRTTNSFYTGQLIGSVLSEEDNDLSSNGTKVGPSNSSGFTFTCDSTTTVCTVKARTVREQGDSYLAGFYNTFTAGELFQFEAYYLGVYKKWIQKTSPLAIPDAELMSQDRTRQRDNLHTIGARLTNRMGTDRKAQWEIPIDWSIEYAWQSGPTGRRIDASWDYLRVTVPSPAGPVRAYTEREKYNAYAFAADAGYTIASFLRIGVAYNVASGDKNRSDGVVTTFNSLFPTSHGLYGQADLVSWQNMIGKSIQMNLMFGKFGRLKLAAWQIDKMRLEDGWYDGTGALKTNESTESFSNTRFSPLQDSSGYRASAYLRKGLLKEYDLTYIVPWKRVEIGLGYSRIQAGDSIREAKNDTLNTTISRRPRFDPRADFAYLMLTMSF